MKQEPLDKEIVAETYSVKEFVHKVVDRHEWRQAGPYLECILCDPIHAIRIGTNLIMTGVGPNGIPIFKDLSKVS